MPVHIKLYGSKGERFEAIKRDLTGRLGYEPSNPEVVGFLMAGNPVEEDPSSRSSRSSEIPLSR